MQIRPPERASPGRLSGWVRNWRATLIHNFATKP